MVCRVGRRRHLAVNGCVLHITRDSDMLRSDAVPKIKIRVRNVSF
jgi:hypothetical protein